MRVDDLMTTPICTCRPDADLAEAARLMWEGDCGAVPVVDEEGRLVGIVTDRDLCMCCYVTGGRMHTLQVREAMSKKAYACQAADDLRIPLEIMRRAQVHRVPVVDDRGMPIGMLSIGDLARVSAMPGTDGIVPDCDSVTSALADICEPRPEPEFSSAT